jgi:uncharacterized damage-inducible protein DinB
MDTMDRLLDHDRWATSAVLHWSRDLSDGQMDQEFDIGHRTLRATFEHLITVIEFWTGKMTGGSTTPPYTDHSLATLTARYHQAHERFAEVARRIRGEHRLDEVIEHDGTHRTFDTTIIHLVIHSAVHRSEAQHILHRLGVPEVWDFDPQEWEMNTQAVPAHHDAVGGK